MKREKDKVIAGELYDPLDPELSAPVSIGDRSIIAPGSVVTRDVPADVIAAGNPARVIRDAR